MTEDTIIEKRGACVRNELSTCIVHTLYLYIVMFFKGLCTYISLKLFTKRQRNQNSLQTTDGSMRVHTQTTSSFQVAKSWGSLKTAGKSRAHSLPIAHTPLEPGRSTHCSLSSISPHSTFLSRKTMSCFTFPSDIYIELSSARQFCLFGTSFFTTVSSGTSWSFIFTISTNGRMSTSALPIVSSTKVSLS